MVEIIYGDHYKQAELAGKSVAEARGQYQDEFGIPSKAQAKLNDKWVKTKREADTELSDDDQLCFAEKSRKGFILVSALLVALAVTGGVFAYGAITGTIVGVGIGRPVFMNVTPGVAPNWTVFTGHTGNITAQNGTFTMSAATGFSGDVVVRAMFMNPPALRQAYSALTLNITVRDNVTPFTFRGSGILTLYDPVVSIPVGNYTAGATLRLDIASGYYVSHPTTWPTGAHNPIFLVRIVER
jgi:hypothetical protein